MNFSLLIIQFFCRSFYIKTTENSEASSAKSFVLDDKSFAKSLIYQWLKKNFLINWLLTWTLGRVHSTFVYSFASSYSWGGGGGEVGRWGGGVLMFTKHQINNSSLLYANKHAYYTSNQKPFSYNKKTNLKHQLWSIVVLNEKKYQKVSSFFL